MKHLRLQGRSRGTLLVALVSIGSTLWAVEPLPELPQGGAIPKTDAWRILERRWEIIEPIAFTSEGSRYIGTTVRFSGKPESLKTPIIIKLHSGVIAHLQKVQKTDRDELANFRKPPGTVIVEGPITALDPATRTVTIKAVSTSFYQ